MGGTNDCYGQGCSFLFSVCLCVSVCLSLPFSFSLCFSLSLSLCLSVSLSLSLSLSLSTLGVFLLILHALFSPLIIVMLLSVCFRVCVCTSFRPSIIMSSI